MALINCPECGKEISDLAASCPNCGCPIKPTSPAPKAAQNPTNVPQGTPPVQPPPVPPYPNPALVQQPQQPKRKESALGIIGLILSVIFCFPIFPILGLILCIIAIRDKKHSSTCATIGLIISIISLILSILVSQYTKDKTDGENPSESSSTIIDTDASPSSQSATSTVAPKPTESPVLDETQNREEFIASCEEIPYKTLARYPDENTGKHITLTVKITQILQGGLFDNTVYYRVYTDNDGYGLYFDDEYVMYDSRLDDNTKLLVDDIITVYGEFVGTESMVRALTGTAEDIPAFKAYYIDIHDENSDMAKEYVTLEKFNQVETGMTYEEVVEIMGAEGEVISSAEIMGTVSTIYSWQGKDAFSSVIITFLGDAVESKTQTGLD